MKAKIQPDELVGGCPLLGRKPGGGVDQSHIKQESQKVKPSFSNGISATYNPYTISQLAFIVGPRMGIPYERVCMLRRVINIYATSQKNAPRPRDTVDSDTSHCGACEVQRPQSPFSEIVSKGVGREGMSSPDPV